MATNVRAPRSFAPWVGPFEYPKYPVPAPLAALANKATVSTRGAPCDGGGAPAGDRGLPQPPRLHRARRVGPRADCQVAPARRGVGGACRIVLAAGVHAIDEARRGWPRIPRRRPPSRRSRLLAARRDPRRGARRLARSSTRHLRRQRMIALVAMAGGRAHAFPERLRERSPAGARIFRESSGCSWRWSGLALLRRSLLATELNRRAEAGSRSFVAGIDGGPWARSNLCRHCRRRAVVCVSGLLPCGDRPWRVFRWLVAVGVIMLLRRSGPPPLRTTRCAFSHRRQGVDLACVFFTARAPSSSPR